MAGYKYRSKEEIEKLGLEIASKVLREKLHTQEAAKQVIFREKDLTEEQIRRICETANSTLAQDLLRSGKAEKFEFPIVDPTDIITEYFKPEETPDVKSYPRDYVLPPNLLIDSDKEDRQLAKAIITKDRPLPEIPPKEERPTHIPIEKQARRKLEELEYADGWLESKIFSKMMEALQKEADLKQQIREGLLNQTFSLGDLELLGENNSFFANIISDVISDMGVKGDLDIFRYHIKVGESRLSPDETIDYSHPLFKLADELYRDKTEILSLIKLRKELQDKLNETRQTIIHLVRK